MRTWLSVSALTLASTALAATPSAGSISSVQLPQVHGAETTPLARFLLVDALDEDVRKQAEKQVSQCQAGRKQLTTPRAPAVLTAVPGEAIYVMGHPVAELDEDGFIKDAPQFAPTLRPLQDALNDLASVNRGLDACRGQGKPSFFPGQLLLALDERLPVETVGTILNTAGQAQFGTFALAVEDRSAKEPSAETSAFARAAPTWEAGPSPMVLVDASGFLVYPGPPKEPPRRIFCMKQPCRSADDYLYDELVAAIPEQPDQELAVLFPQPGARWLATARTHGALSRSPTGHPRFRDVIYLSPPPSGARSPDGRPPTRRPARDVVDKDGRIAVLVTQAPTMRAPPPASPGTSSPRNGSDPIILGAIDRSLIDKVIKKHMGPITRCYQRALQQDPSLRGKIVVKFVIAKDGSVSSSNLKSTTMGSESVEQCVVGRFDDMQFPLPKGGGIVIVSYPFIFTAG